jgi:lipoprotein-anchoring transpeptidase ErfK/SrfK
MMHTSKARIGGVVTLAALMLMAPGALAARTAGATRVAPAQETVELLASHVARSAPKSGSKALTIVNDRRPITGERTVLPVIGQAVGRPGQVWLRVRLPGRTLGAKSPPPSGWINASKTLISSTPWHVVVNLRARRVLVYRDGKLLRGYTAIVGKPSTPTPTGQYFVEETVTMSAGQPGGPFALATNDRSRVFQDFDGGPGQIAIHGLENLGGKLGYAVSHGCIRVANSAVTWLAARIGAGVPITIS